MSLKSMLDSLNRAFVVVGTDEQMQAQARARHIRTQMELLPGFLADCGVGELERGAALGKSDSTQAMSHAVSFLEHPTEMVAVLTGGVGCGKSTAAAFWLSRAARKPIKNADVGEAWELDLSSMFITSAQLRAKADSFAAKDRRWMEDVQSCHALVIDDLGTEGGDIRSTVDMVIGERNRFRRKLLITTNLDVTAFAKKYDQRSVSRILQAGQFRSCGARDLRLLKVVS